MSERATGLRVLECAGAPRDLGLDQGMAARGALRRFAASLGLGLPADTEVAPPGGHGLPRLARVAQGLGAALRARSVGVGRAHPGGRQAAHRLARDLARHFPQLAERCEGLARGARIPALAVLAACARELERDAGAAIVLEVPSSSTPLLLRTLPASPELALGWRRSRPENGLRSLEIASAVGLGAVAGLNEAGLAVAWAARGARLAAAGAGLCAAPATLFVQECLQRFESVAGAAAWCADRPGLGAAAGGAIHLLLADVTGAVAGVTRSGDGGAVSFAPRRIALDALAEALGADARGEVLALDPAGRRARRLAMGTDRARGASGPSDGASGAGASLASLDPFGFAAATGWLAVVPAGG